MKPNHFCTCPTAVLSWGEGGLARGHGFGLFAFGGAYWPGGGGVRRGFFHGENSALQNGADFSPHLLAALLYCVSFGDPNPRIPFLTIHSRFRRCGVSPLLFEMGGGIFRRQNVPLRKILCTARKKNKPPPPQFALRPVQVQAPPAVTPASRTSYRPHATKLPHALAIFLNISSHVALSEPEFLQGCHFTAKVKFAFLMFFNVASLDTPRIS